MRRSEGNECKGKHKAYRYDCRCTLSHRLLIIRLPSFEKAKALTACMSALN
jgi:hypothetical protein